LYILIVDDKLHINISVMSSAQVFFGCLDEVDS
jgi:hypothetical protein